MSQIKKFLRSFLFQKIFPRGRQYIHDISLEKEFFPIYISDRKIKTWITKSASNTVVILAHPYIATAKQFFYHSGHIGMYKKLGASVVVFDFNGFGETPLSDFQFDQDIKEVYMWVLKNMQPKRCILHGISFGASQLIKAGNDPLFNNSFFIIENCLDKGLHYFKKRKPIVYRFLQTLYVFTPELKVKDDFVSGIQNCVNIREMLFIYGKNDLLTTTIMGIQLYKNCPVPSQFIELPGGHLEGINQGVLYKQLLEKYLQS